MTDVPPKRPRAPRRKAPSAPASTPAPETDGAVDLGLIGESMGFLLKRAQMAVFHDFIRTFAAADIRPAQFSVLSVIERNPGLKQSQVSTALSIKRTNFVPLLDGLEARGLVKRKPAATDRRSHALHLTAKGVTLMEQLNALWREHEQRVRDRIGPDGRVWLLDLLPRLTDLGDPSMADDPDAPEAPAAKPRAARPRAPKATAAKAPAKTPTAISAAEAAKPRRAGSPRR
ncbi:MarR family winged helix-turn-helix transcriptional regulator [Azospirillum sp.]|uniref:MarR family winged helix-turn-helix transcriptional regulator n=1 Tax=Azospirillum sp. TaxID=34012 RepID=UPI002D4DE338|nr:MarR family winged helix-turn-helix transcriptional regulator [Azospirillum sp.]HYD69519.1 MarR family winged helix-turn-helix transcriptional regulator [Azospirillum sp.]